MVDFGTDYWHAMDKDKVEKITISPRDIGLSSGIGDPWMNIQAHIKAGASHIELGFMGMGKGSISQPTGVTPESISKEKREDIRQLAKLNDVTLSTHASANAMGFAGLNPQEGKFSERTAEQNIREVKRAIDFAADTAGGGPVVIHTGEFPRSIVEAERKGGEAVFEASETEETEGSIYLVNKETGKLEMGLSKDMKIPEPKKENGEFIFDEHGEMVFKKEHNFTEYIKEHKKEIEEAKKSNSELTDEEYFYKQMKTEEKQQQKAELGRWRENMEKSQKQKEKLSEQQAELYRKEQKKPGRGHGEAFQMIETQGIEPKEGTPEHKNYLKDPIKYLDKAKENIQREIDYAKNGVEGHARKLEQIKEQEGKIQTLSSYATKKTAENIAKLGLYAYEVEKKQKLKHPLVISPENIFPEQYGSHPQELRNIVVESRKKMAEQLIKKKVGKTEADKIAADRIKATFDIGHANTWKKYFKGNDKDFKKWLVNEAKKLQKEGIIGNIHLADNFGFEDEHLTPGQGNAPIEEFIKEIRAEGYEGKFVVEPGSQSEQEGGIYTALTGAWEHLSNSPMYRVGGGAAQSWTDISGGYLGSTHTTRYVQGTLLPNKETWGWYSDTPME
ncbi:MAG: TIM barrel protein [archaeon]